MYVEVDSYCYLKAFLGVPICLVKACTEGSYLFCYGVS